MDEPNVLKILPSKALNKEIEGVVDRWYLLLFRATSFLNEFVNTK
jgi:hypothetical protein